MSPDPGEVVTSGRSLRNRPLSLRGCWDNSSLRKGTAPSQPLDQYARGCRGWALFISIHFAQIFWSNGVTLRREFFLLLSPGWTTFGRSGVQRLCKILRGAPSPEPTSRTYGPCDGQSNCASFRAASRPPTWNCSTAAVSLGDNGFRSYSSHIKKLKEMASGLPRFARSTAISPCITPKCSPKRRSSVLRHQFSKAWQFLNFVPRQPFA